ncbi:HYC_CC_PP family protein [Carboxylicivirga sp. N1Y90]|uniref:HYC_CC_PP family protein n=1 Tax=Carboxylicivirga fragile TaxID=3417571 RepID=UPI003D32EB69
MLMKVRHIIRQVLMLVMVGLFLLTTSGFRLHSHYCSHKGETSYSILIPVEQCSCQEMQQSSCCSLSIEEKHADCNEGCCSDVQSFSLLKLDGLHHAQISSLPLITCLNFLKFSILIGDFSKDGRDAILVHLPNETVPPLPRQQFLSRIQVYLI